MMDTTVLVPRQISEKAKHLYEVGEYEAALETLQQNSVDFVILSNNEGNPYHMLARIAQRKFKGNDPKELRRKQLEGKTR